MRAHLGAVVLLDAPIDVAPQLNPGNPIQPFVAKALPVFGLVAFLDHTWNDRFTSSIDYSRVDISNSDAQSPSAFQIGQYGIANVLYVPVKDVLAGASSSGLAGWTSLNEAYAKYETLQVQEGKDANYIPALAKVDPNLFGIALVTTDGEVYADSDTRYRFH